MNILNEISGKKDSFKDNVDFDPGIDDIAVLVGSINFENKFDNLTDEVSTAANVELQTPGLPEYLEKKEYKSALNSGLLDLLSINHESILQDLPESKDLISIDMPDFDAAGSIRDVITGMLPIAVGMSVFSSLPGEIDIPGLQKIVDKIKSAGENMPGRFFHMLLDAYDSFINILKNPDKLVELSTRSFEEIWISCINSLISSVPYYAIDKCREIIVDNDILRTYNNLLIELSAVDIHDEKRMNRLTASIEEDFIPIFKNLRETGNSLVLFAQGNLTDIEKNIEQVTELTAGSKIILDEILNPISNGIREMADAVAQPITAIGNSAVSIKEFLEQVRDKTTGAINTISGNVNNKFNTFESYISFIEGIFNNIESEMSGFFNNIDITGMVGKIKTGCTTAGHKIEELFSMIEEAKLNLSLVIDSLDKKIDSKYIEELYKIKIKIQELLGQITGILGKPEVQDVLQQARDGIKLFKNKIDEVSLATVFEKIVDKTKDIEGKIKSINASKLGAPQKAALRAAMLFIKEIDVEKYVKPELINVFKQIQVPILNLASQLEANYSRLEKLIIDIKPGTLLSNLLKDLEAYKQFINTISGIKPSNLLAPLKNINNDLVSVINMLDPGRLLDMIQGFYNKLENIIQEVSPLKLLEPVKTGINTAYNSMLNVKNNYVPYIMQEIRNKISIQSLLTATGFQDAADNELWKKIVYYCKGEFLDEINQGIENFEQRLAGSLPGFDISVIADMAADAKSVLESQLNTKAEYSMKVIEDILTYFSLNSISISMLETNWVKMLTRFEYDPCIVYLLKAINPVNLKFLQNYLKNLEEQGVNKLNMTLYEVKRIINDRINNFSNLTTESLTGHAPIVIKNQFIEPVKKRIIELKQVFAPFEESINAIQEIIVLLETIPVQIDAAAGNMLEDLEQNIYGLIDNLCTNLANFKSTVTVLLNDCNNKFNEMIRVIHPYRMLNSFSPGDFVNCTKDEYKQIYLDIAGCNNLLSDLLCNKLKDEMDNLDTVMNKTNKTKEMIHNAFSLLFNKALELNEVSGIDIFNSSLDNLEDLQKTGRKELDQLTAGKSSGFTNEEKTAIKKAIAKIHKSNALHKSLMDTKIAYDADNTINNLIRLNRVVLEAMYPDLINFSVQSVFIYMKKQIAGLYPEDTVKKLESIYDKIIEKIKELPDQIIARPLDQEYDKLEQLFREIFDFSGIFNCFYNAIDELDEELGQGFELVCRSYDSMLTSIEQRLA